MTGNPLFTPGPRLGWVFRDRHELAVPYPEPAPDPQAIQAQVAAQAAATDAALDRSRKWVVRPSIAAALLVVIVAGYAKARTGSYHAPVMAVAMIAVCLPGLGHAGWRWRRRATARRASPQEEYQRSLAAWGERAARHQAAEEARLDGQPEWGSMTLPATRTDTFGGTLAGWRGLLTVHGASLLAERPVLIADLTGQHAARQLMLTARAARVPAAGYRLPADLGRSGLLAELPPGQLATAIAEAIHASGPNGPGSRADRALDVRVMQELAQALGGDVTPGRLAAAVRAALGSPVPGGVLSAAEAGLITGDLFATGYREQVMASLARLEAALASLALDDCSTGRGRPAWLTCLVLDPAALSASGEILTSLLVQWLTIQVTAGPVSRPAPAVILAGADEVTRAHAERLADACELRGVPLALMFRQEKRDDTASLLGGGTTAFMRLGNHAQAQQAADYIGRRHTFVLSSFTATHGGSLTTTTGTSDSHAAGRSSSDARTASWSDAPAGDPFSAGTRSGGHTRTTGTSTTRTQGTNWSAADGTNWSETETRQRVYEYAVEPTILQQLPDHALLIADRSGRDLRLRAVECAPSIAALPGATTGPLPPATALRPGLTTPRAADRPVPPPLAPAGELRVIRPEAPPLSPRTRHRR